MLMFLYFNKKTTLATAANDDSLYSDAIW